MSTSDDVQPLCFVLMPFGTTADVLMPFGTTDDPPRKDVTIDFDAVYQQVVLPAIKAANLKAVRADEEQVGGFIHKSMYERLILCDYAVADLTTANASVYYQLGVRHALRPRST